MTDELVYLYTVILLLLALPIILYFICTYKLGWQKGLAYYFMMKGMIVFLLTTSGHFYYYLLYNLNFLPSQDYSKFFLGLSVLGLIIFSFINLIAHMLRKTAWLPWKMLLAIFIFWVVWFHWMLPLGHKYNYAKRLGQMEELFASKNTEKVTTDGDIMIGLVESDYDRLMQPRYRSPGAYDNFFYMKNDGDFTYTGNVYLTLYNKNNHAFEVKLLEDVEVPANSTLLLTDDDNNIMTDEWNERSFKTKQLENLVVTKPFGDSLSCTYAVRKFYSFLSAK